MSKSSLIKKDAEVVVITGDSAIKGKRGKVVRVLQTERQGARVIVEGLNLVKRHTKKSQTSEGGIIEKEAPIHISNLVLASEFDARSSKAAPEKKPAAKKKAAK